MATSAIQESYKVIINSIGGDLNVRGDEDMVHFRVEGGPSVQKQGDTLYVQSGGDCNLVLPSASEVTAKNVGGDARCIDVTGDIELKNVGGDLFFQGAYTCEVKNVGGDLVVRDSITFKATNVGGDLLVENVEGYVGVTNVGGDMDCHDCAGGVFVDKVGGDLSLRNIEGPCVVECVEGDLLLAIDFEPGNDYNFVVEGAVEVNLGTDANVTFILPEDVEIDELGGLSVTRRPGQILVKAGNGEAIVHMVTEEFSIVNSDIQRKRVVVVNSETEATGDTQSEADVNQRQAQRRDILDQLAAGTLSPDQAIELLNQNNNA